MLIRNSAQNVFLTLNFYNLIYFCSAFIEQIPDDPWMNMWRGIDSAPLIVRNEHQPQLSSSFKVWSPKGGWIPSDTSAEAGLGASSSHVNAHEEMRLISSHHSEDPAIKPSNNHVGPYESIIIQTLDHIKEPELTNKEKVAAYAHLMEILRQKPELKSIFLSHAEDPERRAEVWEVETLWRIAATAKSNGDEIKSIEEIYGSKSPYQIIIRKFFDLDSNNLNAISDLRVAIHKYLARTPLNRNTPRAQALGEIESRLEDITSHQIQAPHDTSFSTDLSHREEVLQKWQDAATLARKLKGDEEAESSKLSDPDKETLKEEYSKARSQWQILRKKVTLSESLFANAKQRFLNLNHNNEFEVQEFVEQIGRLIESQTLVDTHLKLVHEMRTQLLNELHRFQAWKPTQGWEDVPRGQKSTVVKESNKRINDPTISFMERASVYSLLERYIRQDRIVGDEHSSMTEQELSGLSKGDLIIDVLNGVHSPYAKNPQVYVLFRRFIALNKGSADSINSLREDLERLLINNQRLEQNSKDLEEGSHLTESLTSEASSSSQRVNPAEEKPLSQHDKELVNKMKELLISEHYPLEDEIAHEAGLTSNSLTGKFKGLITESILKKLGSSDHETRVTWRNFEPRKKRASRVYFLEN